MRLSCSSGTRPDSVDSVVCIARFTVKEDPDFGLLLESVNGVPGSEREQTYWEILAGSSGEYNRLDVGEYPPRSFNTAYLRKT